MNTKAMEICLAVVKAGGKAYITGGCVRDMLLGRDSKDVDVEVFGLSQAELETILHESCARVDFVGAQYGIYKADGIDVGFARRDKGHGKDAEVEVDPNMTIEEAAKRRDLTVNALYLDPFSMVIHDPFGGRHSLEHRVVRHVNDDTFHKDPLRPIRAARFEATLGFDLDYNTLCLCRAADKQRIKDLPKDRVLGELKRVLMEAPAPSKFFRSLDNMDLLHTVMPELHLMKSIEQGERYHPEGSVFNHTMLAIDAVPMEEREFDVMLALLFHDLGKALVPAIKSEDKISFKGHAEALDLTVKALARITNEIELTHSVLSLVSGHMRPYNFAKDNTVPRKAVRRLAASFDFPKLMKVHKADRAGRQMNAFIKGEEPKNKAVVEQLETIYESIKDEIKPIVTGRDLIDLGHRPGPHFGAMLKQLFEYQLEEHFADKEGGVALAKILFEKMRKEGEK